MFGSQIDYKYDNCEFKKKEKSLYTLIVSWNIKETIQKVIIAIIYVYKDIRWRFKLWDYVSCW